MLAQHAQPLFKGLRAGAALLVIQLATAAAHAQEPPPAAPADGQPATGGDAEQSSAPAAQPAPSPAQVDKLIEQMIRSGDEQDDIAWLYSNASEFEPTALAGEPIPAPGLPERGEGSRRTWNPEWRRFGFGNYVLTGVSFAAGAAAGSIRPRGSPWRGHNEFDETVRDAIGVEDYDGGIWARDASDVFLSVMLTYPLLFDSLIVMYWYRQSGDVAGQMALISAEALSVASALQGATAGFASRERPYGRNCGSKVPADLDDCQSKRRFRSFFSGHATMSFAGAAVSCSHHAQHRVFGSPTADGISCAAGMLTAASVATLRVIGEQHYATDVLVGAGIGTLSGLGVPWLLHYGPLARVGKRNKDGTGWNLVPVESGLGVGGKF